MSTRKLILTALVCGLAIIVAGGTKLFLVATDTAEVEVLALGTKATQGDMTVRVQSIEQFDDRTDVTVGMAGIEGADAREGWRVIAGGKVLAPRAARGADGQTCPVRADSEVSCVIEFAPTTGSVTVAYLRAGQQSQWAP